jgi:hypothetical protein
MHEKESTTAQQPAVRRLHRGKNTAERLLDRLMDQKSSFPTALIPNSVLRPHLAPNSVLRPPLAAPYVGLAVQTLAKLRVIGGGPRFVVLGSSGRSIGYRICDLDDWLSQRVRSSTSDPGQSVDKCKPPPRARTGYGG